MTQVMMTKVMTQMKTVRPWALALPALLVLSCSSALSCSSDSNNNNNNGTGVEPPTAEAVATYAKIVEASYADSHQTAVLLNTAIEAFLAAPDEAKLQAAKQAWLDSREPYLQTEVYRFYDGPIDNPDDGPEGLINAWPLDENYIDYTVDEPGAGIVNNTPAAEITASLLEDANEVGGDANISTGYHAIEFLLWGQDLSETGPGERPATDYTTEPNAEARSKYLTVVTELLVDHLKGLHTAWAPTASYRTDFEANPDASLRKILTGMLVLSGFETGGERLQAALDTGEQEEEHSCFSDNTHRDMIQDVQGVQNVYLGKYTRVDGSVVQGTSVKEVIAAKDAELAQKLEDQIAESLSLANAMHVPFDREIAPGNTEGNARVAALVTSLRAQEQLIAEAFRLFGFDVPADPE